MTRTMERRRYNRIASLLNGEEQVMIENGTQWVRAAIVNLSAAGALLTLMDSDAHFPVGDTFNLFFDNGGQPLRLKAAVLRTEERQIAFEFSDLSPDANRAIHTKLIRMAITSARISAIDGYEVPLEFETSQTI